MATKGNGLPPQPYKKMLKNNYLQTPKEANSIKNFLIKNRDPIIQNKTIIFLQELKEMFQLKNILKKWHKKPEKNHIKRIPIKVN